MILFRIVSVILMLIGGITFLAKAAVIWKALMDRHDIWDTYVSSLPFLWSWVSVQSFGF